MADHVVDGGADRAREAAVVEGRRDGAALDDELMAEPVQFAGGDARLDMRRDEVERFRRQTAGPAHPVEPGGIVHFDAAGFVAPVVSGFGVVHAVAVVPGPVAATGNATASNKWLCRAVFKP